MADIARLKLEDRLGVIAYWTFRVFGREYDAGNVRPTVAPAASRSKSRSVG